MQVREPPDFETHGEGHTKSKIVATNGPTKWTLVQQKKPTKTLSIFQDFKSKLEFQKTVMEYFGDVTKHMGAALKSLSTAELKATYNLGGAICKYCAPIIYVQVSGWCHV